MISVFLVDDEQIVRQALKYQLQASEKIEVIGECSTGEEAIHAIRDKHPQLVLLDIHLPDVNGFHVAKKLLENNPSIKIIVVTGGVGDLLPSRLFSLGTHGFITKDTDCEELIMAIKKVFQGERVVGSKIVNQLAFIRAGISNHSVFDVLSNRELEVMFMVLHGADIAHISQKLQLNPKTVSTYRMEIHRKLNIDNDVALLHLAAQNNLINTSLIARRNI